MSRGAPRGTAAGRVLLLVLLAAPAAWQPASAAPPAATVMIEQMTSPELRDRIAAGATTVLIPIGGTEQNGPQIVLGKHNVRVRVLAERIAGRLGHTVVAPVVAYVPEGAISPPTQHMRWTGTISIPDAAFEGLLEGAARSLRSHGLRDIVLLGDHGGYRASLERVAARLNREFATAKGGPGAMVHALPEYYRASSADHAQALKAQGYGADEIGQHAGLADTALALAVDPALVRADVAAARRPGADDGVSGDPRRASAEIGRAGLAHIVDTTVEAIRQRLRRPAADAGAPNPPMQRRNKP